MYPASLKNVKNARSGFCVTAAAAAVDVKAEDSRFTGSGSACWKVVQSYDIFYVI